MNREAGFPWGPLVKFLVKAGCILVLVFGLGCDNVDVNDFVVPPSVDIDADLHRTVYNEGDSTNPVILEGSAKDENVASSLENLYGSSLVWSSNQNGELGRGGRITVTDLAPGPHIITLTATDTYDNIGTDEITIYINPAGNSLPEPVIHSPEHLMNFYVGRTIVFSGSATDKIVELDENGIQQLVGEREITGENLLWESNIDGELGKGVEIQTGSDQEKDLAAGLHTITLWAFDDQGIPAKTSVDINIVYEEGTTPSVRIQYYDSQQWWEKEDLRIVEGQSIRLRAIATDPQDGQLIGDTLTWKSSIDGDLGSGEEITTESLSENENNHIVTVTARDSDGNERSDQIKVKVGPYNVIPTVTP